MSKNTLILKQKQKYGWAEIYIMAEDISPLLQILDALKANDVETHVFRYCITDEKDDYYRLEGVNDDDVS